jgi:hypothetical protein
VTLQLAEVEPEPLETALVGPGNDTDAVTVYVFKARGFDSNQEAREFVASLRRDARKQGRLIGGPTAFRSAEQGMTAFYVAIKREDRVMQQIGLIYFRGRAYRFSCNFLGSHAADMDAGCKLALDSLEIDGLKDVPL